MNTIEKKHKMLGNVTGPGTGHEGPQAAMDPTTMQKTIQKVTEGNEVGGEVSKPTSILPTTKTQAQPTPMPSLSPVLA